MQKRFRKFFTSVKEHSSVSYAKVATAGGFCDVDLIIIKATSPDDLPLPERYINELLKIFLISPSSFRAFSIGFTRRFSKTHCWRVALKCLILLHRLLRALPENSPFRSELLWSRSNNFLSLYPCHFRDDSSSTPRDYTIFIKSYAQLLDEALDCVSLDGSKTMNDYEEADQSKHHTLSDKMKEVRRITEILPQLQSLIDRIMDCKPSGAAARSFIVQTAMKHIIRDSFICYTTFRKEIILVLDNLFQMPYRSCILAFGIYKKAALQANQLTEFYDSCKAVGFCGAYEYPFVDRIPQIQIQALENFLDGMWQLTESSSSTSTPTTLISNITEDNNNDRAIVVMSKIEEKEPLIRFDDDENESSWEDLLEASVNLSTPLVPWVYSSSKGFHGNSCSWYESFDDDDEGDKFKDTSEWKMQVYNPFNQPYYHGSYPSNSNSAYPWGL